MIDEELLNRCNCVHNNKYDYSKYEYRGYNEKSIIICPMHGEFEQTMHNHLNGQGCPKCGQNKRLIALEERTKSFIEKAKLIHNGKYVFSKSKYVNNKTKITVICPEHGVFTIRPKCGNIKKGIKRKLTRVNNS